MLPLHLTNFVPFLQTLRNVAGVKESAFSDSFSQNIVITKFKQGDGHGKLRNGHGKVMEKRIAKSVGTLNIIRTVFELRVHPAPGVHILDAGCTAFGACVPTCACFLF